MALLGTIVVALALIIGALNGLRRGTLREGMALIGVSLGGLLVTLWLERWGAAIAQRTGWQVSTGQWIAAMVLLWGTALLGGYSSASLLPRRSGRMTGTQRAAGAVLGLINAGLLMGLTFRYTQTLFYGEVGGDPKMTWIRSGVASRFLLDRFDLILLGAAWAFAVIALVVTLFQLTRRFFSGPSKTAPAAPAKPAAAPRPIPDSPVIRDSVSAIPQQTPPGMERSFLDKPGASQGKQQP